MNDLRAENAVYHIQCSWNIRTGKVHPNTSVLPEKRGRLATADKEIVFLEIVEYIEFHSDKQFDITTLVKMIEKKLSKKKVLYFV